MADAALEKTINDAWEDRAAVNLQTRGAVREAVDSVLDQLDSGRVRVAERTSPGQWSVNQWLKKAVLLSFRLNDNQLMNGPGGSTGGTRCRSSSRAVARTASAKPASAPYRGPMSDIRHTSPATSF